MTPDGGDPEGNRYLGSYNGFNNYGTYEILVYAEDTNGIVSDPISTSVVQTVGPDVYEIDDTVNQSKVINLNDITAQSRNFHDAGNNDWVKFYAFQNKTYEITAENVGSNADVVIKLYAGDKTTLLLNIDDDNLGGTELSSWRAPQNGIYYLRVYEAANRFGVNTGYELRVYRPFNEGEFGVIRGIVASDYNLARLSGALVTSQISGANDGVALTLDDGSYILVTKIGANIQISSVFSGFQPANEIVNRLAASEIVEVNFNLSGIDFDSDGIPDSQDQDDDNDTMPDTWEITYGLNPLSAGDANHDGDLDGLTNQQEYQFGSDPTKVDSDGDGYSDLEEYNAGTNPLDENDTIYSRKGSLPAVILLLLK